MMPTINKALYKIPETDIFFNGYVSKCIAFVKMIRVEPTSGYAYLYNFAAGTYLDKVYTPFFKYENSSYDPFYETYAIYKSNKINISLFYINNKNQSELYWNDTDKKWYSDEDNCTICFTEANSNKIIKENDLNPDTSVVLRKTYCINSLMDTAIIFPCSSFIFSKILNNVRDKDIKGPTKNTQEN